jgi:two-component system nitrogen regulation response regulator GlnG
MPRSLQAKMLRLLQEQAFERVGGNKTVQTDVRIIAATHRNLKAMSQLGTFRPDLYYRLDIFTVHLPALRQRGEVDVAMLVRHFLRRFNRELNRDVRMICPEAMAKLCAYVNKPQHFTSRVVWRWLVPDLFQRLATRKQVVQLPVECHPAIAVEQKRPPVHRAGLRRGATPRARLQMVGNPRNRSQIVALRVHARKLRR